MCTTAATTVTAPGSPTGARRRAWAGSALAPLLVLTLAACEGHEFEPPDRGAQIAQADSLYSPALFDTIAWPSDSARVFEGNNVYATHCRKCHGPRGEGGTEYAQERNLRVPSLVRAEWPEGEDVDAVRRRIFTGHLGGMPTWGVAGITPREIDAVAWYLVTVLRPEMRSEMRQ